jgi:hypothetical protein
MAETLSLVERIGAAVETQIKTIKETNGYPVTLVNPRRPRGRIERAADMECFIEMGIFSRQQDGEDVASNEWVVPFSVSVFLNIPRELDTTEALDKRINRVWAAVCKAVLVDRKWGLPSFVHDTQLEDPEFLMAGDGSMMALVCNFSVRYEHKYGDPFTVV